MFIAAKISLGSQGDNKKKNKARIIISNFISIS